jgi:hypothetical protein
MHTQKSEITSPEIGALELTADELDAVAGGMRNNQTEAWAVFQIGIMRGFLAAGGPAATCGLGT